MKRSTGKRLLAMMAALVLTAGELAISAIPAYAAQDTDTILSDNKDSSDVIVSGEDVISQEADLFETDPAAGNDETVSEDTLPAAYDNDETVSDDTLAGNDNEVVAPEGTENEPVYPDGVSEAYDLWVGTVRVTEDNKNDVLGNGKVSYDSDTKTLKLNNVTSVGSCGNYEELGGRSAAIFSDIDGLTITGKADLSETGADYCIYSNKNIYYNDYDIVFDNADLKLRSKYEALHAHNVRMKNGKVYAYSDVSSSFRLSGTFNMIDGDLYAESAASAEVAAIQTDYLNLSGGNVTTVTNGTMCSGIACIGTYLYGGELHINSKGGSCTGILGKNFFSISGGSVYVEAIGKIDEPSDGIYISTGEIEISGGVVDSKADNYGMYAKKGITIGPERAISRPVDGSISSDKTFIFDFDTQGPASYVRIQKAGTPAAKYNLWVGGRQVTSANKDYIRCDSGYAEYDPDSYTLTFYNAKLTEEWRFTQLYHDNVSTLKAAVQSKEIPLKIKGKLEIDCTESAWDGDKEGIYIRDSKSKAIIDADITIKGISTGIWADNSDLEISGGRVDIEASWSAMYIQGDVTLTNGVRVLSPPGATLKKDEYGRTYVIRSSTSISWINNVVIGVPSSINCKVTFDMNGISGTKPASQSITPGGKASKPSPNPESVGYMFAGWYMEPECRYKFDFSAPVWEDFTVYAKWIQTEFMVDFNLNGHGNSIASQTIPMSGTVSKPADPTEAGYTFGGWFTDPACTYPYNFYAKVNSNFTLYAKWINGVKPLVTLYYDLNGYGTFIPPKTVAIGTKAARPADPTDPSKVFDGWYEDMWCSIPFDFKKPVNGDLTIYAKWTDPKGFIAYFDVAHDTLAYNADLGRYEHVYTGSSITPGIIVKNAAGTKDLIEGTDYIIKYKNNINVDQKGGSATAVITGKGNYTGSKSLSFYILPKLLGDGISYKPAEGINLTTVLVAENATVDPIIYYNDNKLVNKKDYTLSSPTGKLKFKESDPGTEKKITITGKGNYTGSIKEVEVWVISATEKKKKAIKVSITGANNIVYDGSPKELNGTQLIVKDSENHVLSLGHRYDVVYTNNINAGTAKVTVIGKGVYSGSVTKTFKILPDKDLSLVSAIPDSTSVKYTADGAGPKLTVTAVRDSIPKTLKEGVDYKIAYSGNKKVTTKAAYKITFIGNYAGQKPISGNYSVIPGDFDTGHVKVSASSLVYTKPGKYISNPYVTYDGVPLKGSDYTVTHYVGTQDLGKTKFELTGSYASVKVVVTGRGNYQGTSLTFDDCYRIRTAPTAAIDLSKAKITMQGNMSKPVPGYEYTGEPIVPDYDIFVPVGREYKRADIAGLTEGTDYTVTLINNKEKGNATILLNAVPTSDKAVKSKTQTFKIGAWNFLNLSQLLRF